MNVFELVAKLTLDTKEYEDAMNRAKSTAAQDGIKKGIAATAAAGVAALGALAVSSVKTGMEFDQSMAQVAATLGITMDELNTRVGTAETSFGHFEGTLRDFARFMGENTAFSAKEAADALNYMALAGYDTQKSMNMLPTVLNLAAAGSIDLARASDMVTDAQSALGLSEAETIQMIDQMALASTKGNTSVAQLGEAFLSIGATARDVAGGTNELATIFTVLADNSIKGAEAGTHLRNIMLALQQTEGDGAKLLDSYNISLYDGEGKMRSMIDVIGDLRNATANMSKEGRDAFVNTIFNRFDLAAVNALLNTTEDRFDSLTEAIEGSAGAAAKMADTQLDNLAGDVTKLKSAFSEFQIKISDGLEPVLRLAVQGLTNLIQNFDQIAPIVIGAATAFGVFAVAINITNIIKSVATAMTALNAVLAANPIGIVIALLAGLAAAFVTLWKNNEEFRNKVTAIWEAVKSAFSNMVDGIRSGVQNAISAVQNMGSQIRSAIQNIISNALSWGKDLMSNFISGIKSKIGELGSAISSVAQKAANLIGFSEPKEGPLSNFHTFAPDMMKLFAQGIRENENIVEDAFNDALSMNAPSIKANFTGSSSGAFAEQPREIVFNVTEMIDGSVLARNQYRFNLDEADRHGGNLINAYA